MEVKKHLKLLPEYFKISLGTAVEYKANFIIQVTSMVLNDIVWIVFWWIFFTKFAIVNGWQFNDILMLFAVITISYGVSGVFFGNRNYLANIIATGKLDFYLTLPKNSLWHILISRSSWFDLGDIVFGTILAFMVLNLSQVPLFIILCLIATLITVSFGILIGSMAFFWGGAEETSRSLWMGLISLASYPITIFRGYTKFILLTLIPAGFIGGIPVELLKSFDLTWFILMLAFSFILLIVAIIVFNKGLKRYESGNLINIRM